MRHVVRIFTLTWASVCPYNLSLKAIRLVLRLKIHNFTDWCITKRR